MIFVINHIFQFHREYSTTWERPQWIDWSFPGENKMGNPMDFPDYELKKKADPVRDVRSTKCWQHKPAALPSAFDSIYYLVGSLQNLSLYSYMMLYGHRPSQNPHIEDKGADQIKMYQIQNITHHSKTLQIPVKYMYLYPDFRYTSTKRIIT